MADTGTASTSAAARIHIEPYRTVHLSAERRAGKPEPHLEAGLSVRSLHRRPADRVDNGLRLGVGEVVGDVSLEAGPEQRGLVRTHDGDDGGRLAIQFQQ